MSDTQETKPEEDKPRKPVSPWRAVVLALCLIIAPAYFIGPTITGILVIWILFSLITSLRAKLAPVRGRRLANLMIYMVAVVLVLVIHHQRIRDAQAHGDMLVLALKKFRADHQRYPPKLDDLVPKYAGSIPMGAYSRFFYSSVDGTAPLFFFVTVPPFGRRAYCFEVTRTCIGRLGDSSVTEGWYDFD